LTLNKRGRLVTLPARDKIFWLASEENFVVMHYR